VPSRWLTSRAGAPLREQLADRRAVAELSHHGAAQLFADATTYVCVMALRARPATALRVHRDGQSWQVAHERQGAAPWTHVLAGPELAPLMGAGPTLGQVARVAKGAGSNADPVFLVPREATVARGEPCRLRAVRGRDVRAYDLTHAVDALLPYDAAGKLVPLGRLGGAAAHLRRHAPTLRARERGRFAAPGRWHAWGRPQNLAWLRDPAPKIVVPDAARGGRAALDLHGTLVIDSAYAIRPRDATVPLGLLLAVLASPVVERWLGATGMPLRGGYFRMKTDGLSGLPLPDPSTRAARDVATRALAMAADDLAGQAELAERVLALYSRA
jgi:hypothetical protein